MNKFLKNNEKLVTACIISFAVGFSLSLFLVKLYGNRDIVGSYCLRTAKQAQEYFRSL